MIRNRLTQLLTNQCRSIIFKRNFTHIRPRLNNQIPFAIERELPEIPNNRNKYIAYGIAGILGWVSALGVAINYQKQNTSITNSTLFICKYDSSSQELLGDNIDFAQSWPWISGSINHLKGKIDIQYKVKGDKDEGVLHFKAIRKLDQWIPIDFTITSSKTQQSASLLHSPSVQELIQSEEMNRTK